MRSVALFTDSVRECVVCGITQPRKQRAATPDGEVLAISVQVYRSGPGCPQPKNAGSERICQACLSKAAAAPSSAHGRKVAELLLRRASASLRKILEALS